MKKNLLLLFILLAGIGSVVAQPEPSIHKETFLYAVKGTDSLYLDKYDRLSYSSFSSPCLVFVFGGGFYTGSRNDPGNVPFFEAMADAGYSVVAIDYRLGFKNFRSEPNMQPAQFLGLFTNTINNAVEDLFDATAFILENRWNIDTSRIVVCGSSAGAVTVLQAEYALANGQPIAQRLPAGFNYAGVISMAGAILSMGELNFRTPPCPILLFHGNADRSVPYDKIEAMGLGFYGSHAIAAKLREVNSPYWFYDVNNGTHGVAGSPMTENREEILSFLRKMALGRQQLMIHTRVDRIGEPERPKTFTLMDYVQSNFGKP